MTNSIVMASRRGIILVGKYAPFVVVALTAISNIEAFISLTIGSYAEYNGAVILYKPVSWFIGDVFKISLAWIFVLLVLSIGVEACKWNRISIAYLLCALWQRNYFAEKEVDETVFGVVLLINIIISSFLVYKGVKILISK